MIIAQRLCHIMPYVISHNHCSFILYYSITSNIIILNKNYSFLNPQQDLYDLKVDLEKIYDQIK